MRCRRLASGAAPAPAVITHAATPYSAAPARAVRVRVRNGGAAEDAQGALPAADPPARVREETCRVREGMCRVREGMCRAREGMCRVREGTCRVREGMCRVRVQTVAHVRIGVRLGPP